MALTNPRYRELLAHYLGVLRNTGSLEAEQRVATARNLVASTEIVLRPLHEAYDAVVVLAKEQHDEDCEPCARGFVRGEECAVADALFALDSVKGAEV